LRRPVFGPVASWIDGGVTGPLTIKPLGLEALTRRNRPTAAGRIKPDLMGYGKDVSGSRIQVCGAPAWGSIRSSISQLLLILPCFLNQPLCQLTNPPTPTNPHKTPRPRKTLPPKHPPTPPTPPTPQGGCRQLSGTSVASPVVAGCVALLASTVPPANRWALLNPASMKQALVEGSVRLPALNMFEQGSGRIDLERAEAVLADYSPRASLIPAKLDFTDCPYMWPHCRQPLYAFGMPLAFNATVLNGMGVTGRFVGAPRFEPSNEGGGYLGVTFSHSDVLWPWTGYLGVFIEVRVGGWGWGGGVALLGWGRVGEGCGRWGV